MKFKAINRVTKKSEYIIEANNLAQARVFISTLDPKNEKYLVVEEAKYKAVKGMEIERKGLIEQLDRQVSLCST